MSHASYEQWKESASSEQEKNALRQDSAFTVAKGSGAFPVSPSNNTEHGDIHSALSAISSGILGGHSPLLFNDAINTAQAGLGNRATMAFARQQHQGIHDLAQQGFQDTPRAFPFQAQIQRAFGPKHNINGLTAYSGPAARTANTELDSVAYHKGGQVAFGNTPTLEAAAHEAAHYVQNLDASQLRGGVGEANDVYERHADSVAEAVVKGETAAHLLDQSTPGADN